MVNMYSIILVIVYLMFPKPALTKFMPLFMVVIKSIESDPIGFIQLIPTWLIVVCPLLNKYMAFIYFSPVDSIIPTRFYLEVYRQVSESMDWNSRIQVVAAPEIYPPLVM